MSALRMRPLCSAAQGTQLYDAKAGGFRDLGILDVMQVSAVQERTVKAFVANPTVQL